ncbi:shikimate dehydrogenase [Salinisphaera sp.]|uniref:shikimate dehydrogenase n=1 Tax=Salinisphaera sp. TaxID=1914330 RepID=UPI000C57CC80|nr:shikimate dehydrogenase [Salinisphaera sp.]MBS61972.1 shikimate dehydrogenase [Salinisphaera sp.]
MTASPDRYAVIGHPVDHSRSPDIHAAFARQTGQTLVYERLPAAPDAFAATVAAFFAEGGAGLNVTLPFKGEAAAYADRLTDRARRAGAVNTLAREDDGTLLGDNTDGIGLARDLERQLQIPIAGSRILILGAGGAVRGVIPVLFEHGAAAIHVANRTAAKAEAMAADFTDLGDIGGGALSRATGGWDIVVNAISAGLTGETPDVSPAVLDDARGAYDMIYADQPTPFLRWVAEHGIERRCDGFGMLVEQAAESFALWRGVHPQTADVIAALRPGGDRHPS